MTLQFTKPERISLKTHPHFSEKWVQDHVSDDPSILGLGDLELVQAEKIQPKAGRLDLLLHDDDLNRRYEVELMLGATDPSHIMRCIEYWDIERRHYPAYDHVAVLVAEDITSRFLNVISLLSGSIPLIAIQMSALQVDDKIVLHFVRVLDQTTLRSDDKYEGGNGNSRSITDREYWEKRTSNIAMNRCDSLVGIIKEITGLDCSLRYRRRIVDVLNPNSVNGSAWIIPRKTLIRIGGYVEDAEAWVKRFDDLGMNAGLKRGNKAALASFQADDIHAGNDLLREFIIEIYGSIENNDGTSQTSETESAVDSNP